jgi:hypothetical protein
MNTESSTAAKAAQASSSMTDEPKPTYVIMLDYLIAEFPEEWPISGEDQDLNTLRDQASHDGNPKRVSKQLCEMTRLEPKALKNVRTGRSDAGGIYEAREKTS